MSGLETTQIKRDFPILSRLINGKPLVYLDNAATSQKPQIVLDAITDYYSQHNANVHRGVHTLSEEATSLYETSRGKVAEFINAFSHEEVIFTKGTTESINFLASTLGHNLVHEGDVILLTELEHHSNMVPWQILAEHKKARLEYIEVDNNGEINFQDFEKKLSDKVKIVAIAHASNVLGTIFPVKEISKLAHKYGAKVIVDGAQAVPHIPVNVQSLGCDAYAFSAHKMLGPTGVGVLWVKREILSQLEPYQYGGGMIDDVSLTKSTWASVPEKFEAGTPNIEGVVAFASAIDYLNNIGMENIQKHEQELLSYAFEKLAQVDQLKIFGPKDPTKRTGLIAFSLGKLHSHDIASVLNSEGIAVRSGHHCAFPLHKKLNLSSTTRASFYLYNSKEDIDMLVSGLQKALKILS